MPYDNRHFNSRPGVTYRSQNFWWNLCVLTFFLVMWWPLGQWENQKMTQVAVMIYTLYSYLALCFTCRLDRVMVINTVSSHNVTQLKQSGSDGQIQWKDFADHVRFSSWCPFLDMGAGMCQRAGWDQRCGATDWALSARLQCLPQLVQHRDSLDIPGQQKPRLHEVELGLQIKTAATSTCCTRHKLHGQSHGLCVRCSPVLQSTDTSLLWRAC